MVNRIEILEELKKYPVFNTKTIREIINKDINYSKLVAHRLKKSGLITELERDKYTVQKDALLVASHIVWPSYLSSWSAIRYYNLTEQLPNSIQVITTRARKKRSLRFQNTIIEFARIKKENFFGYGKIPYGEFEIFMADKEKGLADALYLKQISADTLAEILKEHKKEINVKKLLAILKKMKIQADYKKVKRA